jgi:hypothetical protein
MEKELLNLYVDTKKLEINKPNFVEEYTHERLKALAEKIDNECLKIFNIPSWIFKRQWILGIYAKICRLEMKEFLEGQNSGGGRRVEFWKRGKKLGEF